MTQLNNELLSAFKDKFQPPFIIHRLSTQLAVFKYFM